MLLPLIGLLTDVCFCRFKCPYHFCAICHHYHGRVHSRLFKCLRCPRAFHVNCIPPGSKFDAFCLLCPKHPDESLPQSADFSQVRFDIPASLCLLAIPLILHHVQHLLQVSKGTVKLWGQMILPDYPPSVQATMDHHFMLPVCLREEVGHIRSLSVCSEPPIADFYVTVLRCLGQFPSTSTSSSWILTSFRSRRSR